jgi:putative flippase GtrA
MLNHESIRYLINGIVATSVNYGVLNFNMLVLDMNSAGLANFIAAIFGINASFLGSRYFVYKNHNGAVSLQIVRFLLLYGFIAVLSGLVLYVWSDIYGLSYHIGFIIATLIQMLFSYFGNKILVFKNEN